MANGNDPAQMFQQIMQQMTQGSHDAFDFTAKTNGNDDGLLLPAVQTVCDGSVRTLDGQDDPNLLLPAVADPNLLLPAVTDPSLLLPYSDFDIA